MIQNTKAILTVAVLGLLVVGCSGKVDSSKPIDQVQSEVQTMSLGQLQKTAEAFAREITSQKSEVEKVTSKLKDLSPTELLGDKAKTIKSNISKIKDQLSALTKRYDIYAGQFKALGGDISQIK